MGAYRAGADPQLDRAIAMHDRLTGFLGQPANAIVPLDLSFDQLAALIGDEG
jgi:flagellum-specific ATP synthase